MKKKCESLSPNAQVTISRGRHEKRAQRLHRQPYHWTPVTLQLAYDFRFDQIPRKDPAILRSADYVRICRVEKSAYAAGDMRPDLDRTFFETILPPVPKRTTVRTAIGPEGADGDGMWGFEQS